MKISKALWAMPVVLAFSSHAFAWSDHSLGTYEALSGMKEVQQAPDVEVESLDRFLGAESKGLAELLDAEESWAKANVPEYPARPGFLRFEAGTASKDLRPRFLGALRVNPGVRLGLYLQQMPGQDLSQYPSVDPHAVTTLSEAPDSGLTSFVALAEGDQVPALEVVTTAADEPDYGTDIGLWQDNHTWYGALYGFGKQPFGNPSVEFSSQSPFHMGFYHESGIVYFAAGFLKRTYPEMRIHQALSLARFAFKTGHAYWGWRFTGWALHYLQDLTQPYHSTVLPGVGTLTMLGVSALDLVGIHGAKNDDVQLVTNRHFAIEDYELRRLVRAMGNHKSDDALVSALADQSEDWRARRYDDRAPREVISARSHDQADLADRILKAAFPAKWVDDPHYLFGTTDPNVDTVEYLETQGTEQGRGSMQALVSGLMRDFGVTTRTFVRAAVE